jgi:hypothetical protein
MCLWQWQQKPPTIPKKNTQQLQHQIIAYLPHFKHRWKIWENRVAVDTMKTMQHLAFAFTTKLIRACHIIKSLVQHFAKHFLYSFTNISCWRHNISGVPMQHHISVPQNIPSVAALVRGFRATATNLARRSFGGGRSDDTVLVSVSSLIFLTWTGRKSQIWKQPWPWPHGMPGGRLTWAARASSLLGILQRRSCAGHLSRSASLPSSGAPNCPARPFLSMRVTVFLPGAKNDYFVWLPPHRAGDVAATGVSIKGGSEGAISQAFSKIKTLVLPTTMHGLAMPMRKF